MANWSKKDYYQASESENEEEVALEKLGQRAEVLKESDFMPELGNEEGEFGQLTEDELVEVIERDSPELLDVLDSIQMVMKAYSKAKASNDNKVLGFCKILAIHVSFYLMLKANGKSATNHPVVAKIKELEQYVLGQKVEESYEEESEETEEVAEKVEVLDEKELKKREVDDKIKRNKGIVKKRKKIERNVRVKNKMKYLKKVKIRRSTLGIREVEDRSRYEGEKTGIRKNLVKSVKLT